MKVSVVICTWNRCESLRMTLEQLCHLRIPEGVTWELLIVNNNSQDATDAVVRSFVGRLPIRLVHESKPGQSHARNLAVREARGEYLFWTDDDVIVDPGWLTGLLSALIDCNSTWAFGPARPQWPGLPPDWYSERFNGYFALLDYGQKRYKITNYLEQFYGLNFAGTVAAHRALGGFRVDFGIKGDAGGLGEDKDLFERAFNAQMSIVYTPDAVVKHVIPEVRTKKTYHRRRQWLASAVYYRVLPELFPHAKWLAGLPRFVYGHFVADGLSYLRCLMTGRRSDAFYHELRLVRFGRLILEAGRKGFRRPTAPSVGAVKESMGS